MNEQQKAAAEVMEEWLSHPEELGKKPAKLEIAGEFDLHDLHYYIFRFKKSKLGSWKVAVCGGYDREGLGHCGHIYSEMEQYDPATAQEKCVAMVEKIRQYWMERAKEEEENQDTERRAGDFLGFVLLSAPEFDVENFRFVLKEDWGLECPEEPEHPESKQDAIVFEIDDMMVTVGLMDMPVPDGEAEYWANSNFMTREKSVAAAKNHKAHLLVAVLGGESKSRKAGELFVKIACACLKAPNALGIYDCGTVWLPEHFNQMAMVMKEGELPLGNLVFVGLYQDEQGVSSWTSGLNSFGKDELEVVESSRPASEVYDFMLDISAYILEEGAILRDGETIGFSPEQKLSLTRSEGVYVKGKTIKIGF